MASKSYLSSLSKYLSSPLGMTTPRHVADILRAVDPNSYGMGADPSQHAIHAARAYLESVALEDRETPRD